MEMSRKERGEPSKRADGQGRKKRTKLEWRWAAKKEPNQARVTMSKKERAEPN